MKHILTLLIILTTLGMVSAETVYVDPYETVTLPRLDSTIPLDTTGLQRTYLYCSWWIDNQGETAILMSSERCPESEKVFTFDDDQKYHVRIDYAKLGYSTITNEWVLVQIGTANNETYNYEINVSEPPTSLFEQASATIWTKVKFWLCRIFPFLGFCS